MTKTGAYKNIDPSEAAGRLRKARAYHEAAKLLLEHGDFLGDADPVMSNAILAAIAYADAVTIAYGGRMNQKDHATATKLLRDVLGKTLPDAQERRLGKMLKQKDEVQYGGSFGRTDAALQIVGELYEFGEWAQQILKERGFGA